MCFQGTVENIYIVGRRVLNVSRIRPINELCAYLDLHYGILDKLFDLVWRSEYYLVSERFHQLFSIRKRSVETQHKLYHKTV